MQAVGIVLPAGDLAQSATYYHQMHGFEAPSPATDPNQIELRAGGPHRVWLRHSKAASRPRYKLDGKTSFTLQVNDLDATVARLKSNGIHMLDADKRVEGVGFAISITDPFGSAVSLLHQTIRKVEPFAEPRVYNFGFYMPAEGYDTARKFWCEGLGFAIGTERYLPNDAPLVQGDAIYFMLHMRETAARAAPYPQIDGPLLVFAAQDLEKTRALLGKAGAILLTQGIETTASGHRFLAFREPFGQPCEVWEVK